MKTITKARRMLILKTIIKLPIRLLLTPVGVLFGVVCFTMYDDTDFTILEEIWGF